MVARCPEGGLKLKQEASLAEPSARLEVFGVEKAFASGRVLRRVSLSCRSGEVRALLGENGAGKSTLVKIISGAIKADAGEVRLDGEATAFAGPLDALRQGVGVVYQELTLFDNLSIADNLFIGSEPTGPLGFIRATELLAIAEQRLQAIDLPQSPTDPIDRLTIAERHLLEFARATSRRLRVLILDEPTSALGPRESAALFKLMRLLKEQGLALLYISHRLDEVLSVCDAVTVLKDGVAVFDGPIAGLTEQDLIEHMLGRSLAARTRTAWVETAPVGSALLAIEDLTGSNFSGISFSVGRGEILGLTGLIGCGALEVLETLVAVRQPRAGRILLEGAAMSFHNPGEAAHTGVLFAPEDRKRDGLALSRTARENVSMGVLDRLQKGGVIARARETEVVERAARQASLAPALLDRECKRLSGGQQQKVMLARCLAGKPRLLVLAEPTRGVDVGARDEIHAILRSLAAEGMTIIVVSSDTQEIVDLCGRVIVFDRGRMAGELHGSEITREGLISASARAAAVARRRGPPASRKRRGTPQLEEIGVPIAALLVTLVVFAVSARHFLTLQNLDGLEHQLVLLGLASLGQMVVILSGGIDLAVGAVVSITNMLSAYLLLTTDATIAVSATLALGALVGFTNATLVHLKFPPFLATYAVSLILVGLSLAEFGQSVGPVPQSFWTLATARLGPIPVATLAVAILFVFAWIISKRTAIGRHLFAFGRDPESARLIGVRPFRLLLIAYLASGLLAAAGGLFLSARVGAGLPRSGLGVELDAIAAVVLGGASLFGGHISVVGTLAGVLVLTLIANGFNLIQVDPFYSGMLRGAIMLAIVGFWAARRRAAQRLADE
jgi:ribose transport system ATP-binding protein